MNQVISCYVVKKASEKIYQGHVYCRIDWKLSQTDYITSCIYWSKVECRVSARIYSSNYNDFEKRACFRIIEH